MRWIFAGARGAAPAGNGARARFVVRNERIVFARARTSQDRAADAITTFAGSLPFVYLHTVWFAAWIVMNEGMFGPAAVFDPYPFGLLTMIVSLEAIFLSTFVMVSQNREAARQNIRADLDFETNLRSEVWTMHLGRALGLDATKIENEVQEIIVHTRARIDAVHAATPPPPRQAEKPGAGASPAAPGDAGR
jgi:uncharacterized membrane protein